MNIRAAGRDQLTGLPGEALAASTGASSSIQYPGIHIRVAERDRQNGLLDEALATSQGTFSNMSAV